MKNLKIIIAVVLAMGAVSMLSGSFSDIASYQGRVYSPANSSTPVADSTTNSVIFRIYNVQTLGSPLWSTTVNNVTTKNGLFSTEFSGFGMTLDFNQDYWLGIEFNNNGEMNPRQRWTTVPYAGRSKYTSQVDSTTAFFGPIYMTGTTGGTSSLFSVSNTAGSGFSAATYGGTNVSGISGFCYSPSSMTAGIYAYGQNGMGLYVEGYGLNAPALQAENKSGGIGAYIKGVTGAAVVSNDINGIGLYVENLAGGTPMIVKSGSKASLFQGGGIIIDALSMPAPLFVSCTAGAWPAAIIQSLNGQGLVVMGRNSGMNKPVVDIQANTTGGNVTGLGATGGGAGGAAVSATAYNGGTGMIGVSDPFGIGIAAVNTGTIGSAATGAALYVSGSVKTSGNLFQENQSYSGTWNVNNGVNIASGPSGYVRFGASYSGSSIATINLKSNMITTSSVVIVNFYAAGGPPSTCAVSVSTGLAIIKIATTTFATGEGFNFLIIN